MLFTTRHHLSCKIRLTTINQVVALYASGHASPSMVTGGVARCALPAHRLQSEAPGQFRLVHLPAPEIHAHAPRKAIPVLHAHGTHKPIAQLINSVVSARIAQWENLGYDAGIRFNRSEIGTGLTRAWNVSGTQLNSKIVRYCFVYMKW